MYPLLPSQQPDINAPSLPDVGRSESTFQVEAYGSKKPEEDGGREERLILTEAYDRFQTCHEYDQTWRKRADEELSFVACGSDHWTPEMKADRPGMPCLSFDRISPSIDQVINDARQNPPEAKVNAVGAGADKDTAEILQGLIRNIDNDSSADIAYMTGYQHAVQVGRGWWRVNFEYESETGEGEALFQQKLVVKRIANPFSVYPDPAAEEFDYSDMRYCFVTEDLDLAVFEELYPDAYTGTGEFQGLVDKQRDDWFPKGAVRVAEYWRVKTRRTRMALLPDGTSCTLAEVPEGTNVISTRWVEKRTVECHKITGAQVLETTAWPGKWIPLIPCLGRESILNGKRVLGGMVRPAMDANLSYDFLRSRQVQMIGLASLAPYLVAAGQLNGYETKWADANRKPYSYLEYNTVDNRGNPVGAPVRNFAQEAAIQAITVAVQHSENDIKAMLSTYDASLGNAGPESSGRAILARQKEGDNAHFAYHDNLSRSLRHTARVELDLVPHIYSEARIITIYDPDGNIRQVKANQPTEDKHGQPKHYKLADATRMDATTGSGPSYASRRKQGAEALTELVRAIPGPMTRALDLLVLALDIPDGDKIADRLRPPDIQQEKDGEQNPAQQMQRLQQQSAQQAQMLQALTQELNQMSELLKNKRQELESKERIATQTNLAGVLKAEISSKSAEAQHLAQLDHDGTKADLEARNKLLHSDLSFEQEQALQTQRQQHEKEQRQAQAQQDQQGQAADQAHEGQMQQEAQSHQQGMQQSQQDADATAQAAAAPPPGASPAP